MLIVDFTFKSNPNILVDSLMLPFNQNYIPTKLLDVAVVNSKIYSERLRRVYLFLFKGQPIACQTKLNPTNSL